MVPSALKSVGEGRTEKAAQTLRCSASFASPHWGFLSSLVLSTRRLSALASAARVAVTFDTSGGPALTARPSDLCVASLLRNDPSSELEAPVCGIEVGRFGSGQATREKCVRSPKQEDEPKIPFYSTSFRTD